MNKAQDLPLIDAEDEQKAPLIRLSQEELIDKSKGKLPCGTAHQSESDFNVAREKEDSKEEIRILANQTNPSCPKDLIP